MKRVVIRVDSSAMIGSGHLMRCLTFANRLEKNDGAEVQFISRDLDGGVHDLILRQGFELSLLPRHEFDSSLEGYAQWLTVPQTVDAEETVEVLKSMQPVDQLVVDSYAIDITWEKIVRPFVKNIFVIDDLANRRHDCDVLLDQNFHLDLHARREQYRHLVPPHCDLRIGLKYVLLRAEFYDVKKHLRRRDGSIKNILVFYGGVDLSNETMKSLRALTASNLPDVTVNVVVGAGNANQKAVEEYCARHGFNYLYQIDNMAELMNEADLALGAGGTTTWERCFLGLPTFLTAIADNQKSGAELEKAGYVVYLGKAQDCTEETIVRAVKGLTKERLLQIQDSCLKIWD